MKEIGDFIFSDKVMIPFLVMMGVTVIALGILFCGFIWLCIYQGIRDYINSYK